MNKKSLILLLLLTNLSFAKVVITVTYPVQEFFIKKIAEDRVYTKIVYNSNSDFKFNNRTLIRKLSSSNYYFKLNLENENEIIDIFKSRNSNLKVFDMTKDIPYLKDKDGNLIPYVWLDPILVRDIATNIYEALVKIRPSDKEFFKKNLDQFLLEIDEIYLYIKKRVDEKEIYGFFSFSHQLDYFAKRYRLNVYHKEFRYLKAKEVTELIKFSRKESIKHIVLDNKKSYLVAQSLASHIGAKIVELDIYNKNWKSNLYKIVRHLVNQ